MSGWCFCCRDIEDEKEDRGPSQTERKTPPFPKKKKPGNSRRKRVKTDAAIHQNILVAGQFAIC